MCKNYTINEVDETWLINHVYDFDLIIVGTHTKNSLGNGFQRQIAVSFPDVDRANNKTRYDDKDKLGTCNVIDIGLGTKVVLCYIFEGRFRPDVNPDTLNYKALGRCLTLIKNNFSGLRMASTVIGNSPFEGGGNRDKCLEIIGKALEGEDVSLFDFPQHTRRDMEYVDFQNSLNDRLNGLISKEEYYEQKCINLWHRTHGYYEPMPNLNFYNLKKMIEDEKKKTADC